ncbi:ankyrin-1-like [Mytilus edulis]|uniref:ankyrin-1-like n=1 Tax=Mytilus edulis TaxID=6550 RepID=UPI0039EE692E
MYREYDTVHKGLRETNGEEIEEWKQVPVAETRAVKRIAELIKTEGIVVAIGSSGCGKSTAIHHAAVQLYDLNGYDIILVYAPEEIRQYYNSECKQVFVIDDLCGKSSIDISLVNSWERLSKYIKKILKRSEVKILSSCRNYIYRDRLFQNLNILASSICDLTSSCSLTHDERIQIAHNYLSASDVKYLEKSNFLDKFDFFPLLCKMYPNQTSYNIQNFFSNPHEVIKDDLTFLMNTFDQKTMATLMLFIAYNNSFNKKLLMQTSSIEPILIIISSYFRLQTFFSIQVVMSELDNLTQSYVKSSGNSYCINHESIFDILILFFGEFKLDLVLKIAHTCIIRDRFIFKSVPKEILEHDNTFDLIQIPEELEQTYFNRLLRDIENGFISNVFSNKQLKYVNFRRKLLYFAESDKSIKDILLHLSQYEIYDLLVLSIDQGYFDIVSLLLTVGKKLQCIMCSNPPVYRATVNGYADIVKLLLDYNFNPTIIGDEGRPLEVAVKKGFGFIVKLLLDHNAICYVQNSMTYYLFIAAKKGYIDMVKLLLKYSTSTCLMHHIVDLGIPLCIAAKKGHINIVQVLLENKASPNSMNSSSETPLTLATAKGHIDIVKMLLEYKANPDMGYHDVQYVRPLFIAVKNGDVSIAKVLLDNGASQDFTDSPSKTPLSIATAERHIDIVRLLLEHMTNIYHNDALGYPLCIASKKGYINIVKLLLDNKASPNFMTRFFKTPLSFASEKRYISIVRMLLEHGANSDIGYSAVFDQYMTQADNIYSFGTSPNNKKRNFLGHLSQFATYQEDDYVSPLCIAAKNSYINIEKMLLDNQASLDFMNSLYKTQNSIAIEKGHIAKVMILLEDKAKPDIGYSHEVGNSSVLDQYITQEDTIYTFGTSSNDKNRNFLGHFSPFATYKVVNYVSPLCIAAKNGDINIAKVLLEHGASQDCIDLPAKTPLSIATAEGHIDIVKLLLEQMSNIYQSADLGYPICIASNKGYIDIVKLLLDNNASANYMTLSSKTPLSLATAKGYSGIVKILLEHGANEDIDFPNNADFFSGFVTVINTTR